MVLISILTHTLAMLVLVLLVAGAVLVAWVLVLLLLPGCRRRRPEVRGGAGYLPGPALPEPLPYAGLTLRRPRDAACPTS